MCIDCGCEAGNAEAFFKAHENKSEDGSEHIHVHIPASKSGDIHIHIHRDNHLNNHTHDHAHEHDHTHEHDHDHAHDHTHEQQSSDAVRTKTVELESKVLARNDAFAEDNRKWLDARGVVAVNLISSPGSGKTYLLERTLEALAGRVKCAVITGDQQTDNDAKRLAGKGAPVVQIETRASCHLDALQVKEKLGLVVNDDVQLLFIENVGNLVCPAAFDLGEHKKIALLSVTEGEDKPLKYPVLFHDASATVITKLDLIPHLDIQLSKCMDSIRAVNRNADVFQLSAKTGEGMKPWITYLEELVRTKA